MTTFTTEDRIFAEKQQEIVRDKSPCDGCHHNQLCKEEEFACQSFAKFVVDNYYYTAPAKNPTKEIFNKVFNQKDEDALRKFVRHWKEENENTTKSNEEK
jgi:hypothetical protein